MATRGGGEFFGKVGSFEPGYEFDAVVLDDSRLQSPEPPDIRSRLERLIWLGDEREVREKVRKGRQAGTVKNGLKFQATCHFFSISIQKIPLL